MLVGLIFAGFALAFKNEAVRGFLLDIHRIRAVLQGSGSAGARILSGAVFIISCGLLMTVGMPRLWISAIAGAIYGAVVGTGLALAATAIGASTVYLLGRSLLGSMVRRRLGGRLTLWNRRFKTNAFWWVLYGRLFPFSNATVMSLLCGFCKVPFSPYLRGSFLGFIPLTLVFAVFGSGGIKGNHYQIALGFFLVAMTFGIQKLLKARFPANAIADEKGEDKKIPQSPKDTVRIAN